MTSWIADSCEANGINIHYLRTGGAKPPLVLLHGLMGGGACWSPVARSLEAEYDVVMPDARGHGSSSAPLHGYRYEDHAADVVGLIQSLELDAPILLGHSMGGMTAALAASQAPDVIRAVVLVDPTFLSPEWQREVRDSDVAEKHRRVLSLSKTEALAQARQRRTRRSSELVELLVEARQNTRMSAFDVLTPPNPEYHGLVSKIDAPILLVIRDSPVVSLQTASELQRLNPRLQVEQIRDAGHAVPYDQPERLGSVVASFLHSVVARPLGGPQHASSAG
jgi:pimeloyl-ACP methyl ester carboxylesterase